MAKKTQIQTRFNSSPRWFSLYKNNHPAIAKRIQGKAGICGDNSDMWDALPGTGFRPPNIDEIAWQQLLLGLNQRMRLMESLTQDLYGPQRSLIQGLLPAELTLNHGQYMPAMQNVKPLAGTWLGLAWFDVAPDPNGQWWVLNQRTGVDPDLVRHGQSNAQIPHLDPVLHSWSHTYPLPFDQPATWVSLLSSQAGTNSGMPGHSDVGLTFAHPEHLSVQNRQLWVRTVDGLRRVHGLINLQQGDVLDPLEMQVDVQGGVAALFDALRQGQLAMVNMPGLGFWNTPAWLGFWPSLCRQWLSEDLWLPSLPTWWLGEASSLEQALASGSQAQLLPTYADDGLHPVLQGMPLGALDEPARRSLRQLLDRNPQDWTLQTRWWGSPPWRIQVQTDRHGRMTILHAAPSPSDPGTS